MQLNFGTMTARDRYKVLTSTVVPRPIAWVTTASIAGQPNAAPFSFFNVMSKEPPLLALGIQANDDGSIKDTGRNILETGEFVVNLVSQRLAEAMNVTSANHPPEVNELERALLETCPSIRVRPPRIRLSPVSFECRLHSKIEVSVNHVIAIGEILEAHIDDDVMLDPSRLYVDTSRLDLIGRMEGRDRYVSTRDTFQIERPS
jgi:flavin reductase (DIM6/NTAB) family NADH-FMN oxidoreductase RutF